MNPALEHWGLRERPFEPVTDPRFYFPSAGHEEARARLGYLVDEETMYFGMLSGEFGSGKSLTRQVFAAQIDPRRHFLVQFPNSSFGFDDLLRRLLNEAGWGETVPTNANSYQIYEQVTRLVRDLSRIQNRHLVLMFDEAQEMSTGTLSRLKQLSNLNDEGIGRLTIVLMGQPELRQIVGALPPLDQRISLRFHLRTLEAEEVAAYVQHRLLAAGHPTGELFHEEALELLHEASRGVAREVNRLAKLCLDFGRAAGADHLGGRHVLQVINDLRRHQVMPELALPA